MSTVAIMVPITIAASMVQTGTTIPEVATGETAWVSGSAYVIDDLRNSNGSIWSCVKAHTGVTTLPENDPVNWLRKGPTLRMAPFDDYRTTSATATGTLTYVLTPGFFNGVWVDNPKGDTCTITVKDAPGGTVVKTKTTNLFQQAGGLWELLFTPLPALEQVELDNIPVSPGAELTVTIAAAGGGPVGVGDIKVGDWRMVVAPSQLGGAQAGAKSKLKSYSTIKENEDGTYYRVRRPAARQVSASIIFEGDQALYVDSILREVLDIAVPFRATGMARFAYLNTLAFLDGELTADSHNIASLSLTAKGTP